ncbi:MAG: sensor histidine kinase [Bacilli bacterium]|nr:sensor histidine kinase [Bacilli bacterium]
MTGILVVVIGMSLLFGRQLGIPILHILNWLKLIAAGTYLEPTDATGRPRSRHAATGLLKSSYRLYQEVIDALEHLTGVLKHNEENRKLLEQTREEWITGVSHDLKTPLSSVKGYAELLSASHYQWTEEEIRNFGRVIAEKAAYMQGLMEDLSLTFHLKNNALPLQREPQNVVELVRRSVIDMVNQPAADGQHIHVHFIEKDQITYPLDPKWFKRAIDNLLANASLHNPVGTTISVRVESLPHHKLLYPGILIEIVDDGKGMDEETVSHLFDRYYRGTNTSAAQSTGTGLGTAIAKQLIEAHGGSISVYSRLNEGTSVIISFPGKI